MAANPPFSPIPQDPPDPLVKRTATVGLNVTNTIRVPHDRFHDEQANWFNTSGAMLPVLKGNQVKFYVDGINAYPDMVGAIRTASQPGHFIYMMNWFCDLEFPLLRSSPPPLEEDATNLKSLLRTANEGNVMLRAMFWKLSVSSQNRAAVEFFNSIKTIMTANGQQRVPAKPPLRNAAAIHDDRGDSSLLSFLENIPILSIFTVIPRALGSQHQKVLCVFGSEGLICFCGGIDFNPDRVPDPDDPTQSTGGTPLHDVHCRIIGPAARQLVDTFIAKWDDHPVGKKVNAKKGSLINPPVPAANGNHVVQIGRTFPPDIYQFTPRGEQTAAGLIGHAIRNARRFIYTECQYFVGAPALQNALLAALPRIAHLTVVLTHWEVSDLPKVNAHRRIFIDRLKAAGGDKVRVFCLQPDGNTDQFQDGKVPHTYVHSKIWIIDDEFAVIGSVNSNRRSWTHDTEVCAGIFDPSTDEALRFRFAHLLRIAIWREHLGMNDSQGAAELADGVASGAQWLSLSAKARVRPYNLDERNRKGANDHTILVPVPFDSVLDPSFPETAEGRGI